LPRLPMQYVYRSKGDKKMKDADVCKQGEIRVNGKCIDATENYHGFVLKIIKRPDYSFPYHVEIYDRQGKQIGKTLQIENMNEVNKHKEAIKKELDAKWSDPEGYFRGVTEDFNSKGFKTDERKLPDDAGFYEPKLIVTKDNLDIKFTKDELRDDDNIEAVKRHFDVIKAVYNDYKDRKDVFYSSVSSNIKQQMKYSKDSYRTKVFLAVCDLLEKKGVNVHS